MVDFDVRDFFDDNGTVDELELDEDLQNHLLERGFYGKHRVTFSEILEVHSNRPKYFLNQSGRRAPVIMLGPTFHDRMLCIPIEPTGRRGVWRPVTAFDANTHDQERYLTDGG